MYICFQSFSTMKAMGGSMRFRDSLTTRLNIIKPSVTQLQNFLTQHGVHFSDGVKYVSLNTQFSQPFDFNFVPHDNILTTDLTQIKNFSLQW